MTSSVVKLLVGFGALFGGALGTLLPAPSAVGAASGNGVASMPANQIVTSALTAMQSVTSVTISGVVHQGRQTLALNITASTSSQGQGTIAMNGLRVSVKSTGSTVYMKATAAFWRKSGVPASAASRLSGRWISLSLSDPGATSISSALNSGSFLSQIPKSTDTGTVFTKVSRGTINGQPVVKIKAANPSKPNDNGLLYVATTGTPYVLRIAGSGSSSFGVVNFSHYNQPVHVQPPSGAISLSQIEQQG